MSSIICHKLSLVQQQRWQELSNGRRMQDPSSGCLNHVSPSNFNFFKDSAYCVFQSYRSILSFNFLDSQEFFKTLVYFK